MVWVQRCSASCREPQSLLGSDRLLDIFVQCRTSKEAIPSYSRWIASGVFLKK